jgi:vancomycin permeability regulator SanA
MFIFRIAKRVLAALLLIILIVPGYIALQVYQNGHSDVAAPAPAIVVLGTAQYNGVPSPALAARLSTAITLAKKFAKLRPIIITVGGKESGDNFSEATAGFNYLRAHGFTRLHPISIGRDTLTSTLAYGAYLKANAISSIAIVTDPYHCFRALTMARDLGLRASCQPVAGGPNDLANSGWHYIARETGAYLAYKTVGQVGVHLSDQVKS